MSRDPVHIVGCEFKGKWLCEKDCPTRLELLKKGIDLNAGKEPVSNQPKRFYRYTDPSWPSMATEPHLDIYVLARETPCGYWIKDEHAWVDDKEYWVSKTATRRRAYPTLQEALNSYRKRKERQVKIMEDQLHRAKLCFEIAKKFQPKGEAA